MRPSSLRATVLFTLGDLSAQIIEQFTEEGWHFDWVRMLRSGFVGGATAGWMTPLHLRFMDYLFTRGVLSGVPSVMVPWGKSALERRVLVLMLLLLLPFLLLPPC